MEYVPNRLDAWRRANPNALGSWETKHGCVVAFWGMRVYYGRCRDCSGLVTTRRQSRTVDGSLGRGRWPELCNLCLERKEAAHADDARRRMARVRKKQYEFRDAQFAAVGLPPVRQGAQSYLSRDIEDPDSWDDPYYYEWLDD